MNPVDAGEFDGSFRRFKDGMNVVVGELGTMMFKPSPVFDRSRGRLPYLEARLAGSLIAEPIEVVFRERMSAFAMGQRVIAMTLGIESLGHGPSSPQPLVERVSR